jgi:tetratricopeptide (TPR) repeat protein
LIRFAIALTLLLALPAAPQNVRGNEGIGVLRGRYRQMEIPAKTDDQITFFEAQLKANPKEMQLLSGLATAFLQKVRETGDFAYLDRASQAVDRMRTDDPQNYMALRLRIEIAMQYHQFPKVVDYATELIERNPSDSGVTGLRGDAFMERGLTKEAERDYQRMLELSPSLFSYNRMAYLRFVTGKPDEALGWMVQAVEAGSKVPENTAWAWYEFGEMLFKVGKTKDAEAAYRTALSTFPGHHRAAGGLGRLLAAKGDVKGGEEYLRKAQAAVPLPEYSGALAKLAALKGDKAEEKRQDALVDAVEKLMKANGEKANRVLAIVYADEGRNLARALEIAQAEFEVRDDVYSYDALAWVLHRNGKTEEARKPMERALVLRTPEPAFYFHAGMIALASGDKEKAKAHLEHALALNPAFDFVHAAEAKAALQGHGP